MKEVVVKTRDLQTNKAVKKLKAFMKKRTLEESVKTLLEKLLESIEGEDKES